MQKQITRMARVGDALQNAGIVHPTEEELTIDFAWSVFDDVARNLAEFIGREEAFQVVVWLNYLTQGWQEPVTIPEDLWTRLVDLAYDKSYSFLKSMSIIIEGEPDLAKFYNARAEELKTKDGPDMGRLRWYWDVDEGGRLTVTPEEWLIQHDFGCFGPRKDVDIPLAMSCQEGYYRSRVANWVRNYGPDIVKKIIDIDRVYRLDRYPQQVNLERRDAWLLSEQK